MSIASKLPFLLLASLPLFCWGQLYSLPSPSPNARRYPVTGTVVNSVTDQPIGRALVRLNGPVQLAAFSGADGRFQFDDVPEGTAMLSAQRPGYLPPMPGASFSGRVQVSSDGNDVRLLLTPQSNIEGTVLDSEGEPLESIQIQILAEQVMEGRKRWTPMGAATTDESGAYRFEDLQPGRIVVCTQAQPRFIDSRNMPHLTYAARYYPEASELASAQPLDLKAGETARADFKLTSEPGFVLSGAIAGVPDGMPFWFFLEGTEGLQNSPGEVSSGNGRFTIKGVPAGTWTYQFQANDRQGKALEAELPVSVSGSDVKGLSVVLQPNTEIQVLVNHAASSPSSIQLQLVSANALANQGNPSVAGESHLMLQNVRAGQYNVVARSFGTECIDSISSGSTDLTRNPLLVVPGSRPQPIVINLRSDCAAVSGLVKSSDPSVTGTVLITSDSPSFQPMMAPVQGDGKFSVEGLSPGTYQAYAFSTIEDLEYANPQAMRGFAAQELTLSASQNANVTLSLLTRGSGK